MVSEESEIVPELSETEGAELAGVTATSEVEVNLEKPEQDIADARRLAATPALGGYQMLTPVGSGTMGQVWKVKNQAGELFAAKFLRPDLCTNPKIVDRFLQERKLLLGVTHKNIVQVIDMVIEDERIALIMEFTDGGELGTRLAKTGGTMSPEKVAYYGAAIASGLSAIHHVGIVHRDIKPSNILLKKEGRFLVPKLADFGLARWIDPRQEIQTTKRSGTPYYMAPEMIEGHGVGAKTDIYSLGVILYQLLCGITPFRGNIPDVLHGHFHDVPGVIPGVPVKLWNLIATMLAKEPSVRPSAGRVYTLLNEMYPDLIGVEAGPVLKTPPPATPLVRVVDQVPVNAQSALNDVKPLVSGKVEPEMKAGTTQDELLANQTVDSAVQTQKAAVNTRGHLLADSSLLESTLDPALNAAAADETVYAGKVLQPVDADWLQLHGVNWHS